MSTDDAGDSPIQIGPVQMLVVGFEDGDFTGEILAELKRLNELDVIRLIDLLFVSKAGDGSLSVLQVSDLSPDEAMELGALVGALIGFGMGSDEAAEAGAIAGAREGADGHIIDEDQAWEIGRSIPTGGSAAIALIEHRWALPLGDAIRRAGGTTLADEWIKAEDLIAVGLASAEQRA